MFNNTSRILPYASGQIKGVILPHSENVLNSQDLDKKIEKTTFHLEHLNNQLPESATHGGKRFRAKKISLQNQISLATDRLNLLQKAKATIFSVQSAVQKESAFLETIAAVASMATFMFRIPKPSAFLTGKSSIVNLQGKERTIKVILAQYQ